MTRVLAAAGANRCIPPTEATRLIQTYLRAKDENRPYLMPAAFAPDAMVEMVVPGGEISFPARMDGLDSITQVLVRDFSRSYENIYTFCLDAPVQAVADNGFGCDWLVLMTDKASGSARVGCGSYRWQFRRDYQWRVRRLIIEIRVMRVLPAAKAPALFNWSTRLSYPWTAHDEVLAYAPAWPALEPLREFLGRALLCPRVDTPKHPNQNEDSEP